MSSVLPSEERSEPDRPVPLAAPAPAVATNLPAPLTALLGREREVAEVVAYLRRPGVRLVTLTGPGGVGKTRLAMAAATDLLPEYPDGVWFVPLASIVDPALVPGAIARAVGVRPAPGRPIVESVVEHLGPRRALLVVDNLEQVLGAGPTITTLLAGCHALSVLATSRVRLRLTGEHEYGVPPLSLTRRERRDERGETGEAKQAVDPSVDPGLSSPVSVAMRLFAERARAVQPGFALTAENADTVDQICRRLDGLPLAIELAAARTKLLSPAALLARLTDRFQVLAGGPQDAPDRQRTMRGAIAWSYDLLGPADQELFRRLAVFAGGFTIEGAEGVASTRSVLDGLLALLDHNLVQRQDQPDGEPRLTMLETIRAFGLEQLDAAGESEATRRRHAERFLVLAEEAAPKLQGPNKAAWLDRLELELDNLRAAFTWSLEAGEPAMALRLAGALGQLWIGRGRLDEGATWLERALAADSGEPSVDQRARGVALRWFALIDRTRGDLASAERRMREAFRLFQAVGEPYLIVRGLVGLAIVAGDRGDVSAEEAFLNEALPIARAAGDRHGEAVVHQNLGNLRSRRGDVAGADVMNEAALALFRELDDPFSVGIALVNGAMVAQRLEDFQRATAYYTEALAIFRSLGDAVYATMTLVRLGELAQAQGDLSRAAAAYREALERERDIGTAVDTVDVLLMLMHLAVDRGETELAARFVGAAEARGEWRTRRGAGGEIASHEAAIAGLRADLGTSAYNAAWAAGRVASLDDLIEWVRRLEQAGEGAAVRLPAAALGLTPRELEVVQLLVEGLTDRQIAERLFIARKTASKHVAAVLDKLGLETRTAVGAFAIRHGLVAPINPAPAARASKG